MPLTNVWTCNSNGEWIRTTAASTDKRYSYSVPMKSHHFRCYSCFQYVAFVKGNSDRISHFRHSASYSEKDCEDRSFNSTVSSYTGVARIDMPMRLILDGTRISVSIGLLPINHEELKKYIDNDLQITFNGLQGASVVYRADWSRFAPNTTTWLAVPPQSIEKLTVRFSPASIKPKVWSGIIAEIPSTGALFDAKTGCRIPDKGDVVVNHEYLLLINRNHWISRMRDVQIVKQNINDTLWSVYKVKALCFSESASDFFFDLKVRLTNYPAEMSVLWPPVLEMDTIIETNFRNLKLLVKGEADFETYPQYSSSCITTPLGNNTRLIDVRSSGPLQMVTSERYNHTLQFLYIRPMDRSFHSEDPKVDISFDDGQVCTEVLLKKVPLRGILHFCATDDGHIDVYEREEFYYRKQLPADEKTRITDIKQNSKIRVYAGKELLAELCIAPPEKKLEPGDYDTLPGWVGRKVPFSRRYAWVLEHLDEHSELFARTLLALKQGEIPQDGWNTLQMIMEEHRDVFR